MQRDLRGQGCSVTRLEELNALDAEAAARELRRCCGSSRWAARMAAARPFASLDVTQIAAAAIWWALGPADWLEAFAAHPRIGAGGSDRSDRSDPSSGSPAGRGDADWS